MPIAAGIDEDGAQRSVAIDRSGNLKVSSAELDVLAELLLEVRLLRLGMIAAGLCEDVDL